MSSEDLKKSQRSIRKHLVAGLAVVILLAGGVGGEVRVRDGDLVKAGDIVVRLDETVVRANLAIVNKTLYGLWARQARLEAEQRGADSVKFPAMLLDHSSE